MRAPARLLAAVAALACATAAHAGSSDDPADLLARSIRTIAAKPSSVGALVSAGDAALKLGDVPAAAGFFGRAIELDSRNPAVKAGMGAALVALGKPDAALSYFARARQTRSLNLGSRLRPGPRLTICSANTAPLKHNTGPLLLGGMLTRRGGAWRSASRLAATALPLWPRCSRSPIGVKTWKAPLYSMIAWAQWA